MESDPATLTGAQALGLTYPASMTDLAILQTIAPDMSPVTARHDGGPAPETQHDRAPEAMSKVNPLFAELYT